MKNLPEVEFDGKVGAFHYADSLEARAMELDADDTLCVCGHEWSHHVSCDMRTSQPCDFEIQTNSRIYSDDSKFCGCAYFVEKDAQ